nr:RHS repeat domain-containing protein [Uliginosibacterium gangwonense]
MTRYDYTGAGLIAQRHDALGQTLRYRWDRLGRLLDETGFDGQRTDGGGEFAGDRQHHRLGRCVQ